MTNYIDYYSIESNAEPYENEHELAKAEERAKALAKMYPGKSFIVIFHTKISEHMEETTHNRDITIICPKCGQKATLHGMGNVETGYYCVACGMEIPA